MSKTTYKQPAPIECGRTLVGQNIRRLRLKQGLSQAELAERAEINRAYLSTVENGKRNISIDNIIAIANALALDPRHLLRPLEEDPLR